MRCRRAGDWHGWATGPDKHLRSRHDVRQLQRFLRSATPGCSYNLCTCAKGSAELCHSCFVRCITSIALDHCEFLGSTLDAVAFEKAGIIKPGVPVVVGATCPKIVDKIASQKGSFVLRVEQYPCTEDENRALAAATLKTLRRQEAHGKIPPHQFPAQWDFLSGSEPWLQSLPLCRYERRTVTLPGALRAIVQEHGDRAYGSNAESVPLLDLLQYPKCVDLSGANARSVQFVLDVAHNAAALTKLLQRVSDEFGSPASVRVIFAFSSGKDVQVRPSLLFHALQVEANPERACAVCPVLCAWFALSTLF